MRKKNHIIGRMSVLAAAVVTLFTAFTASTAATAVPATAGAAVPPPDPAASHPPAPSGEGGGPPPSTRPTAATPSEPSASPRTPDTAGSPASPGASAPSGSSEPSAPASSPAEPSSPAPSSGEPSSPGASGGAPRSPGSPEAPDAPSEERGPLPDPAAPDAPDDPAAPGAPGVPGGEASLVRGDPRDFGAEIFDGRAFDTCQAPPAETMRTWKRDSPFGAVGVYIGGRGRACPQQRNLTPEWVDAVHRMGWKLLPLYVSSQSPCVSAPHKRKMRMSTEEPYEQGRREGMDAVRQAQRLGMARRSAVYLDMEGYDRHNTECAETTLRFVQGWNNAVRSQGYLAGYYSSADSGIAHLETARAAGARGLPSVMWFARWRVPQSVTAERRLHARAWQPHRRIHQHSGNVQRTYGGRTLHIDENLVDAPVAVVG